MTVFDRYKLLAEIVGSTYDNYSSINDDTFNMLCGGKRKTSSDITEDLITKERLELANKIWDEIQYLYNSSNLHVVMVGNDDTKIINLIKELYDNIRKI